MTEACRLELPGLSVFQTCEVLATAGTGGSAREPRSGGAIIIIELHNCLPPPRVHIGSERGASVDSTLNTKVSDCFAFPVAS